MEVIFLLKILINILVLQNNFNVHANHIYVRRCCKSDGILYFGEDDDDGIECQAQNKDSKYFGRNLNGHEHALDEISSNIEVILQQTSNGCTKYIHRNLTKNSNEFYNWDNIKCVGTDNYNFFAICCNDTQGEQNQSTNLLKTIRKCCDDGEFYDRKSGKCAGIRPKLPRVEKYLTLFSIGPPICEKNDVLVDLSIEDDNIIENQLIKVNDSFNISTLSMTYCVDYANIESEKFSILKYCQPKNICGRMKCIRKCCDHGYSFNKEHKCEVNEFQYIVPRFIPDKNDQPSTNHDKGYGLMSKPKCELVPTNDTLDQYEIKSNDQSLQYEGQTFIRDEYCIEVSPNKLFHSLQTCRNLKEFRLQQINNLIKSYGCTLSCGCLVITIIMYVLQPNWNNLANKITISNMLALISMYIVIILESSSSSIKDPECHILAYALYISIMKAFSWMNISSVNMYYQLSSMRRKRSKNDENKLFHKYLCYGFGFPIFMTSLVAVANETTIFPDEYRPKFNSGKRCYFEFTMGPAHLAYLIYPTLVQNVINLICFILASSIFCCQNIQTKKKNNDRQKLCLNLKLFLVMGIPWIMEIFLSIIKELKTEWVIYLVCAVNASHGIFYFLIFISSKSMRNKLKHRFGCRNDEYEDSNCTRMTTISTNTNIYEIRRDLVRAKSKNNLF